MEQLHPNVFNLVGLAYIARAILKEKRSSGNRGQTKTDGTLVTEADIAINTMVVEYFKYNFPHIRVLGEEVSLNPDMDTEYTVLCDPIDGTAALEQDIPIFTFAITLMKDMVPVAAVIHDLTRNRTWRATSGGGAFCNNKKIVVSGTQAIRGSNNCLSWWKNAPYNLPLIAAVVESHNGLWFNPRSIAFFGGRVAEGTIDSTVFPGNMGWETAAMQLIVEEAGGTATDIHGNPIRYSPMGETEGHIMSNGLLHQELVEIVASCQ